MNFLETDFKRRRIPKRNTIQTTSSGVQVGFNLEKYPYLKKDLLNLLNGGFDKDSLIIKKGKYTRNLPDIFLKLISKKIESLSEDILKSAFNEIGNILEHKAISFVKEYDKFLEESIESIRQIFTNHFIIPFLDDIDKPLENYNIADDNSKYQMETGLSDSLMCIFENRYAEILQSFFHKPEEFALLEALNDTIAMPEIRYALLQFFKDITVRDAFSDMYQIYKNHQLIDKTEVYLYCYEISFERDTFPIIYLPITLKYSNDTIEIEFDTRIFINTKAIDYVVQESNKQSQKIDTLSGEFDRIVYLNDDISIIEKIIRKLEIFFELTKQINVSNYELQREDNLVVSLSNKFHLFLFDKSDQSLINDYEEILNDNGALLENFSSLLNGFVEDNPVPFIEKVENEWEEKDTPQKLTVESPIPLNDEQKQVLIALQNYRCKTLIIEGPPGTGKSHTITAIVCKMLLEGKSVLVLSDKKEALDVVEDKISQTLNKVRLEDNFQNPILRLGKTGNKFHKLLNSTTIAKIREHYYVSKNKRKENHEHKNKILDKIKSNIEENISHYKGISMDDVSFYFNNIEIESNLDENDNKIIAILDYFFKEYFKKENYGIDDVEFILQVFNVAEKTHNFFDDNFCPVILKHFIFSDTIAPSLAVKELKNYIDKIISLKKPLIGYLFQGNVIAKHTQKFKEMFPYFGIEHPHKNLWLLNRVHDVYLFILRTFNTPNNFLTTVKHIDNENFMRIREIKNIAPKFFANKGLQKYPHFRHTKKKLYNAFENQPEDIFFNSIHEIETLVTLEMAFFLDRMLIEYVDNYAADANNLKSIIRKKKKFPQELFQNLKKAFPCILAGIRDYAEFIPLKGDMFDLIIIDEASQVSVAQALPALIRGQQIVILGDNKQFSNVKSSNAGKVINQEYKSKVKKAFADERIKGEDKRALLNRVENFDIKNSILTFAKFIRNYECLIKKHFRCYPEIISYSDKFFYDGQLQCMKIRGKSIEDVIKFDVIDHDGKIDTTKNTNVLEADFIIKKLKEFKDNNIEQSIGIITPHTHQVTLLWEKINNLQEKDWLFEQCKLKIMTFDTCQGEERDYIFYSMVATREKDRLNYIFLKDFASINDETDGTVKSQRLNVGFSRAKECVHFILSKPVDDFSGELKNALAHYRNELKEGKRKIIGKTDKKSAMEPKIQHFFYETAFYKENKGNIEFIPQFELGKYLKQLDKSYTHPDYKVDFLLIFKDKEKDQKIVIEYDGFREHFNNLDKIDALNYTSYMKDGDIYRQKILEGYGYKFLRINKFNIGDDPIQSLNDRLQKMTKKKLKIRQY